MIFILVLNFCVSFLLTVLLIPFFKSLGEKYKILDYPDKRKIHKEPVPRTGGIAIVFSFIIIMCINLVLKTDIAAIFLNMLPAFILLIIIGLYDDIKNAKAKIKLLFQIITAALLYIKGINIYRITNPFGGEIHFAGGISFLLTLLWVVGLINAINFLDGMDGLASGVVLISNIFLFIISLSSKNYLITSFSIIMIGLTAGFLIYNFPPAKIFMGDTGSMFLGFLMAIIGMIGNRKSVVGITLLVPILLMLFPIIDTALAIFRRIKKKKSIFKPDKMHLHHRLLALGIGYKRVLYIIYLINLYLGFVALLSLVLRKEYIFILFFILGIGILISLEVLKLLETNINKK